MKRKVKEIKGKEKNGEYYLNQKDYTGDIYLKGRGGKKKVFPLCKMRGEARARRETKV